MDTIIHTYEPVCLDGVQATTELRVADSRFKTDQAGHLHVFSEDKGEETGALVLNVGTWSLAVRGAIAFNNTGGLVLVRRNRGPAQ